MEEEETECHDMGSTSRGENSINKTEEEEECKENDGGDDGDEAMNVEIANANVNDDENRVGGRNETFGGVRQSGNDTDVVMDATGS